MYEIGTPVFKSAHRRQFLHPTKAVFVTASFNFYPFAIPPEPTLVPSPPSAPRWGGAIAGWEFSRLARRAVPFITRLLVAVLLFVTLFATYLSNFPQYLDYDNHADLHSRLSDFGQHV